MFNQIQFFCLLSSIDLSLLLLLLLQSLASIIFVESAEGDTLGLITNRSQLDALMAGLNKRGTRESALHQVSLVWLHQALIA
jgi:hypothetical protein